MLLVQLVQQIQPATLAFRRDVFRRLQVDNRIARGAKRCALIRRRHESIAPVRSAADRAAAPIREDNERGQVLILSAEAVCDPAAHARIPGLNEASIHLKQGRTMIVADRIHRADQRDVVHLLCDVRKQLGYVHAALRRTS